MDNEDVYIVLGAGVVLLALFTGTSAGIIPVSTVLSEDVMVYQIFSSLSTFIPSVEGFSSVSYWDVSRWSWGYGTAAPGPGATISQENAFAEMEDYLLDAYRLLKKKVTRQLTPNQWAALLSFAYNLGVGNAYNLMVNINSGDDAALEIQWKKYINSGGQVNPDLVARRKKEWQLWRS